MYQCLCIVCFALSLIGYSGETILTSRTAKITGRAGHKAGYDNHKDCIGSWEDAKTIVSWEIEVKKAGAVTVACVQAAEQRSEGNGYDIEIGSKKVSGKVVDTGSWGKFQEVRLGEIAIQKPGRYTVKVVPHPKDGLAVMNLRGVNLSSSVEIIPFIPPEERRGMYFDKKTYTPEELPTYAGSKKLLPQPILEDNPEWIAMYWKCWELAFSHLRKPDPHSPFVSNYVDEAFNNNIFQWDTIFMVLFWRYAHRVFPAVQSFDNFYCRQHKDGFICREIHERGGMAGKDFHKKTNPQAVNPPLFSWAEVESYRLTGDRKRLMAVMLVLEMYVTWLETGRKRKGEQLYWTNGLGSGMDNTPQGGAMWVEMSAQMVRQYDDLAYMATQIGDPRKAEEFRARAEAISARINKLMWDQDTGFYWNLDRHHRWHKVEAISFSWTLMAGVPSEEQARGVVKNLMDPNQFYRKIPFATLSARHRSYDPGGGYWRGASWAPTTYQAIKGLERYGYETFATEATEKYLAGMSEVFKKTKTVWENYAPDSFSPGTENGRPHSKPDFVGWSGCGPIALLLENAIGLRPDAANRLVTWRLDRIDRHGVERYAVADAVLSLCCDKRKSRQAPAKLVLRTDKPFKVKVLHPEGTVVIALEPGKMKTVSIPSTGNE